MSVLAYLIRRSGHLVTKDELREQVWGTIHVSDTTLRVTIREIRAALGEYALAVADLGQALAVTRSPVKNALMDQRRVAGVGNIYASEALFRAGIDPRRPPSPSTFES